MITGVDAILLISADAKALSAFYSDQLGLPMAEETHEGIPLHYACDIGNVHLAIHPADGWPGVAVDDARSPVIVLQTDDAEAVAARVAATGIDVAGPRDHGFALVASFRDPDGNLIELLQPNPEAA
jgi:catechol-2,3-dioxygenase